MKKLLFLGFAMATALQGSAQQYSPVAVTGFNHDVIANGTSSATTSTTIAVDAVNFSLVAADFINPSNLSATPALPNSGLLNSASTAGLSFQLAPYTGSNALRLIGTTSGTLTFTTPRATTDIYVLAFSGSGQNTVTYTVTFTDNTTQVFTGIIIKDWFNQTGYAARGFSRVNRLTNAIENLTTNPRMYENILTLSAANSLKPIRSVRVTKTGGTGVINLMAISAKNITTGIHEPEAFEFNIAPNPSDGVFMLRTSEKNYTLEIADLTGKILQTHQVNSAAYLINMEKAPKGIYLVKIKSQGKTIIKKLLVE